MNNISVIWTADPVMTDENSKDKIVLNKIRLELNQGEWLVLVGPNGSGKSTLAKAIAGLIPVTGGTVEPGWTSGERMRMVLQNPDTQLIGETVYEDICFGLENIAADPEEMPDIARNVLSLVGMENRMDDMCEQLSGGQKQLVAVAGALAVGASVLILDEVTSMLDASSRQAVTEALDYLHRRGTTVVWITQWMDELALADRVIALDQAEIVFEGSAQDFFYSQQNGMDVTPCEKLGYQPPYSVQVMRELQKLEPRMSGLRPVSLEEWMEVMKEYGPQS
ncbi:ATP-binding cassette domain-containing protein [Paenibacillus sp. FJAT-26967]|uniref:ATP-binding cassette domain-containing protein n=1 Tax=Paenibacillus sp. FJAT-26967 TaxID=1729690 RepID=UPI0020A4BC7B|nr:ATP-binding cassette domain-containing protein [Paenibacillus sp. FJAT-26967]